MAVALPGVHRVVEEDRLMASEEMTQKSGDAVSLNGSGDRGAVHGRAIYHRGARQTNPSADIIPKEHGGPEPARLCSPGPGLSSPRPEISWIKRSPSTGSTSRSRGRFTTPS